MYNFNLIIMIVLKLFSEGTSEPEGLIIKEIVTPTYRHLSSKQKARKLERWQQWHRPLMDYETCSIFSMYNLWILMGKTIRMLRGLISMNLLHLVAGPYKNLDLLYLNGFSQGDWWALAKGWTLMTAFEVSCIFMVVFRHRSSQSTSTNIKYNMILQSASELSHWSFWSAKLREEHSTNTRIKTLSCCSF